ncbi:MAG: S8 family serine peptidase [archaeon]
MSTKKRISAQKMVHSGGLDSRGMMEMDARFTRFIIVAVIVFVAVNVLAVGLLLDNFRSSGFVVRGTIPPGQLGVLPPSDDSLTSGSDRQMSADALAGAINNYKKEYNFYVHYLGGRTGCAAKVVNNLESSGFTIDESEYEDFSVIEDGDAGVMAVKAAFLDMPIPQFVANMSAFETDTKDCLEGGISTSLWAEADESSTEGGSTVTTSSGGAPSSGSGTGGGIGSTTPPSSDGTQGGSRGGDDGLGNGSGEEDEESFDEGEDDDWYEEGDDEEILGAFQLAQSIPLVNGDDVKAQGFTGEGVTICIIDSGADVGHASLPYVALGYNPNPPKGLSEYYVPGSSKLKEIDPLIIDDELGHGTAMAGVVASTHTLDGGTGPYLKSEGFVPNAQLMIAKVNSPLDTKKASKNAFNKAVKFCAGKNKLKLVADVIVTGVRFGPDEKVFDQECLVVGEKCGKGKNMPKGVKEDNIKSVKKYIDKYTRENAKKSKNHTIPFVVPAGNVIGGKSGIAKGTSSLAVLDVDSIFAIGAIYDMSLPNVIESGPGFQSCQDTNPKPFELICSSACGEAVDYVMPGGLIFAPTKLPFIGDTDPFSLVSGSNVSAIFGTSMAAAHAAGVMAQMKDKNPSLNVIDIRERLFASAWHSDPSTGQPWPATFNDSEYPDIPSSCYGDGVINAIGAIGLS